MLDLTNMVSKLTYCGHDKQYEEVYEKVLGYTPGQFIP